MTANILAGIRDSRTPLVVGYSYALTGWIWFGASLKEASLKSSTVVQILDFGNLLGPGLAVSGVAFGAYIVGSIASVSPALIGAWQERYNNSRLTRRMRRQVNHRIERDSSAGISTRFEPKNPNGHFTIPYFSSSRFLYGPAETGICVDLITLSERISPRTNVDIVENADGRLEVTPDRILEPFSSDAKGEFWDFIKFGKSNTSASNNAPSAMTFALMGELIRETSQIAVRLHVASKDLHDEYDRLDSEASLCLSLMVPMAFLFVTLAIQVNLWHMVLAPIILGALFLHAQSRARQSRRVLVQALVSGLVQAPIIERMALNDDPASRPKRTPSC